MTPQEFIDYLKPLTKNNVVLQSLLIAQICLESGFGKHSFYNNYLGIKYHGTGNYKEGKTKEFIDGVYVDRVLRFAVYDSITDNINDYLSIMGRDRYRPVRMAKDYIEATKQIRLCGYATSPKYTENLRNIITKYKLNELDNMKDIYVTPNFRLKEFACKDGTAVPDYLMDNVKQVATQLQLVRDYYKLPIKINSAYRTSEYNKLVGGKPDSYHLLALAVDIKPLWHISIDEFYKKVKELTTFKGFGLSINWVHLDLRPVYTVWVY
jgi:uncharacterized protein YcbK (DUF882 family)